MTNKSSTPEYLRKMLKNILQYNKMIQLKEKRIFINSLKYIPHSLYKMLENIPMPWESQKNTNILYHQSGAILFINEIPRSICKLYYAKWGSVWKSMKKEKKNRIHFSRMRFPPFDDEEVFIDYVDNIYHLPPLQSIKIEKNHYQAIPWLFENEINFKNFIETIKNKNKNIIKIPILQNLKKLSMPILNEVFDKNYFFLFDLSSFIIAKSLNIILPGGPRFEPDRQYFTDTHFENFDSDFNSSSVLTIPIRSEYKVVYSYLYNDKCMYINDFPYMYYSNSFIKFNSSNYVSFYFDPLIYPINYTKHNIRKKSMEMLLSNRLIPIFFNYKLFNKYTKISLELLWSTFPYNTKILDIKRIITISMINNWIREHCPITSPQKVRISFQKLLKNYILNQLHNKKKKLFQKKSLLKILQNSSYFSSTYMDWVEASLITCRQGHNMLNLLIHKKGLNFLHLDYNFNLKPVKTLTTKERKKSRFGNAFHLCREILRLNKLVLDAHIQFRLGNIDSFQLADGVQYLFSHVGHLTGIYRYKYKVMKQIRLCKDLKHLIYFKFNANVLHKGPGVGFWLPMWRVWIFFLRGMVPTLEKWLGNLLIRQFEGRASNKPNKSITKQRIESHFDIELRASVLGEVLDRISPNYRASKAKLILQHLSEAWRCWKANIPWIVQKIPKSIEEIIIKYVKQKADWWTNIAHYNRERIKRGATIDKNICRKNLGRLTRLFLKDYQQKQHFYLTNGPFLSSKDVVVIYRVLTAWVEMTNLKMIKFPTGNYKYGSKLLIITLEHLKDQFSLNTKLNMEQKEEMELIEFSFDNSTEILNLIKRQILIQRNFKEIYIQFMDYFDTLVPVFEINPLEKIADSFLDHFLWLEEYKLKILPNWVKPSDNTLSPLLVYNWCNAINNIYKIWEIKNGETIILMKLVLHEIHSNIDLSFLNRILRLFIDSSIVDYLSSKNNSIISFKDMSYMNILGIIRGIQFSTFIIQLYSITIDLLIIGLSRSLRLNKNSWLQNQDISSKVNEENQHPVKLYLRIINELFILLKIKRREKIEILEKYINSSNNQYHKITDYYSINNKSPTNVGTPLIKLNSNLGNALFEEMKNKVPSSFIQLKIDYLDISIYDTQIPYISCLIEGFQLKIINSFRLNEIKKSDYIAIWKLKSDNIDFGQTYCMIDIANKSIVSFQNRIRHIILTSGSSTFTKISNKWNTTLIGLVTYFRESIKSSDKLLQVIIKSENKIQNRVKMGLNSKMPSRFPPVVFYSPKEFGGLGMISMSHILIPKSELKYSTFLKHDITHFITGMSNSSHQTIPNIYRYISDWEFEFLESLMVWNEYGIKKLEARKKKKKTHYRRYRKFLE
uniref:mRNA splicing factor PRP8 n=1 Tax=Amorphochlora amoebiformis TaxID=1561963 RepID=A0A6T6SP05_9EUKA|mmetsp:Transcript_14921/g.23612  ORF Transcript_14921/g.23612 Transcript_14921/m.23612 type:complete len:1349 (+) Transcript_14921:815-4861(+)